MKDLKTIESRVRAILSNHQEARDDDMILYLLYCNRYGEVRVGELPFEMVMNNYKVFHIPCFESVRRTRQKIQAATPELGCSPEVRRARRKQQGKGKPEEGEELPPEEYVKPAEIKQKFRNTFKAFLIRLALGAIAVCAIILSSKLFPGIQVVDAEMFIDVVEAKGYTTSETTNELSDR